MRSLSASIVLLLAVAPALAAQSASTDSLYRAGAADASYAAAIAALTTAPNDYEPLWRAARAETIRGIQSDGDDPAKSRIFEAAETFARRAVSREPSRPEGHYWLAAAMGRHSRVVAPLSAARLVASVRDEALRILAIDSLNAGGHGLLGKLNSDVCVINPVIRVLAAAVTGMSISRTTACATAERELTRAVALDPNVIVYRADLTELYVRTHRLAEAQQTLNSLTPLPPQTPVDPELLTHAHSILLTAKP